MLTSAFFQRKSATFVISRNTDVDCILVFNFLTLFESLKVVLIKMFAILMMSAKLVTLGFFNYIADMVMWP